MNPVKSIQGVPVDMYILLATILFSIGVLGILIRRNMIIMLMCVEIMLNAVNLLLVAFSAVHKSPVDPTVTGDASPQIFVFFIMVVAAAEAAVGLAILVMVYRNTRSTDINFLNRLKW